MVIWAILCGHCRAIFLWGVDGVPLLLRARAGVIPIFEKWKVKNKWPGGKVIVGVALVFSSCRVSEISSWFKLEELLGTSCTAPSALMWTHINKTDVNISVYSLPWYRGENMGFEPREPQSESRRCHLQTISLAETWEVYDSKAKCYRMLPICWALFTH